MSFSNFNDSSDFFSDSSLLKKIQKDNSENRLDFGISFLDESLLGIQKNDLVLIGAPSGAGKTELATSIALANASQGKKVVYFALEAEPFEIENRIIYKKKSHLYFKSGGTAYTSYDRWIIGECPHLDEIKDSVTIPKGCLRTRYAPGGYTMTDFENDYLSVVHNSDLVILDHIHYFDLETENENKEYKSIIKKIRSNVLDFGKPMVVIAHLRKRDKKYPSLVADQEDFHGTSDLVKISTKSITLAPQYNTKMTMEIADDMDTDIEEKGYTFMRSCKNRRNGSVTINIAAVKYDFQTNTYMKKYMLGEQRQDKNEVFFRARLETPKWAKNKI